MPTRLTFLQTFLHINNHQLNLLCTHVTGIHETAPESQKIMFFTIMAYKSHPTHFGLDSLPHQIVNLAAGAAGVLVYQPRLFILQDEENLQHNIGTAIQSLAASDAFTDTLLQNRSGLVRT